MFARQLFSISKVRFQIRHHISNKKKDRINLVVSKERDDELKKFMHGRKFVERRDSINREILIERKLHREKLPTIEVDPIVVRNLAQKGLGSKRQNHAIYDQVANNFHVKGGVMKQTNTAAGGFSVHVASAKKDFPLFKHLLPELVFAGHSNAGKSTLVNAMSGMLPKKGPAEISDRAGWTDQICFYQLGKRPPVLTLADLPGYGHAVASVDDKRAWVHMMQDYIGNRLIISRVCILIDATRGVCNGDRSLVRFLQRRDIPWLVVLTKADLLTPLELAQSMKAVQMELSSAEGLKHKEYKYSEVDEYKTPATDPEHSTTTNKNVTETKSTKSTKNDKKNTAAAVSEELVETDTSAVFESELEHKIAVGERIVVHVNDIPTMAKKTNTTSTTTSIISSSKNNISRDNIKPSATATTTTATQTSFTNYIPVPAPIVADVSQVYEDEDSFLLEEYGDVGVTAVSEENKNKSLNSTTTSTSGGVQKKSAVCNNNTNKSISNNSNSNNKPIILNNTATRKPARSISSMFASMQQEYDQRERDGLPVEYDSDDSAISINVDNSDTYSIDSKLPEIEMDEFSDYLDSDDDNDDESDGTDDSDGEIDIESESEIDSNNDASRRIRSSGTTNNTPATHNMISDVMSDNTDDIFNDDDDDDDESLIEFGDDDDEDALLAARERRAEKQRLNDELNQKVMIFPVSANTGAGVQDLWLNLRKLAEQDSIPQEDPYVVREHVMAAKQRKAVGIANLKAKLEKLGVKPVLKATADQKATTSAAVKPTNGGDKKPLKNNAAKATKK